jgi:carbon-monoxide dehydrogenase large subunit
VEYDQLPAVVDMEAALADRLAARARVRGTNRCYRFDFPGAGADYAETVAERGEDVVVVKRRFIQQRLLPTAMEPRAVVVAPIAAADEFTVYSATQVPHILRIMLALTTGIPEQKVRSSRRTWAAASAASSTSTPRRCSASWWPASSGRPIKWTESRSENYQATIHGRDQIQDIEIACRKDGTLLGLKVELLADMGAYLQLITSGIPILGPSCSRRSTRCRPTTSPAPASSPPRPRPTPTAAPAGRRPPSPSSGSWTSWRTSSARPDGAAQAELDHARGVPVHDGGGLTYDSGNYEAATEKAESMFDMAGLRPSRPAAGRATTRCSSASASRPSPRCAAWPRPASRLAVVRRRRLGVGVDPDAADRQGRGRVRRHAARPGHHTRSARSWRTRSACRSRTSSSVAGDTQSSPKGMDTYGSRSLVVGGIAIHKATGKVLEKAKRIAAHLLEAAEGDVEFDKGRFTVKGSPEASMTIQQVRWRPSRRTTCRTAWSPRSTATTSTTRRTSATRTAPTCARSRSTPRPGSRRSASTSASTTSARSSIR